MTETDWRLGQYKKASWKRNLSEATSIEHEHESYIRSPEHIIVRTLRLFVEKQRQHPSSPLTIDEFKDSDLQGLKPKLGSTLELFRWKRPFFIFFDKDSLEVTPDRIVRAIDDLYRIHKSKLDADDRAKEIEKGKQRYLTLERQLEALHETMLTGLTRGGPQHEEKQEINQDTEILLDMDPDQMYKEYMEAKKLYLGSMSRGKGVGIRQYTQQFWKVMQLCGVPVDSSWKCASCGKSFQFSFDPEDHGCRQCNVAKDVRSADRVDILSSTQWQDISGMLTDYTQMLFKGQKRTYLEGPTKAHTIDQELTNGENVTHSLMIIVGGFLLSVLLAHVTLYNLGVI
jgi:hypothetical protein